MSAMQPGSLGCHLKYLLPTIVLMSLVAQSPAGDKPSWQFADGWNAYESGDFQHAVRVWSSLAEAGHVNAQINLGVMYDYGSGVDRDYEIAARWYRAAAHRGSAAGQYNLALLIADGHARPLAGRTARYWLEQAAAQGFVDARRALQKTHSDDGIRSTTATSQPASTGDTPRPTEAAVVRVSVSTGTAWPIAAGYAVTNHHIVDGKQRVRLINHAGRELIARVVASDADRDIAVLHVGNPERLPPALPMSLRSAPLGASVFTIGFPRIDVMGRSPKLSRGIISGANGLRDDPGSYQISVPIQQGNSGGPLINMRGEVVGMITSMLGETDAAHGPATPIPNINYALKIDAIRQFLAETPQPRETIDALPRAPGDLESLAARIRDSVLIVMAE